MNRVLDRHINDVPIVRQACCHVRFQQACTKILVRIFYLRLVSLMLAGTVEGGH